MVIDTKYGKRLVIVSTSSLFILNQYIFLHYGNKSKNFLNLQKIDNRNNNKKKI